MDEFETLLAEHQAAVERYVYFRLPSKADGDDVLQEVYLTAYRKFGDLRDKALFKPWLLRIAQSKCADCFRVKSKVSEVSLGAVVPSRKTCARTGIYIPNIVRDTLDLLDEREQQVLYLYYFAELPQTEIAERLKIPLGTVKSRLHSAKVNFKTKYPSHTMEKPTEKGETNMKKLPEFMPEYTITPNPAPPFAVKYEALPAWSIIPRPGEHCSWAVYNHPHGGIRRYFDVTVTGITEIHGIEGAEFDAVGYAVTDGIKIEEKNTFVAQLTDTHCRMLAAWSYGENGRKKLHTFLDGDAFTENWGFGGNNCGYETNLVPRGGIVRHANDVTIPERNDLSDVVERYTVEILGKSYDTVCRMEISEYGDGIISEDYIDQNGRSVLWRRFNRDDWAFERFGKRWSEMLPDNERITVNGDVYVHRCDSIGDYIL